MLPCSVVRFVTPAGTVRLLFCSYSCQGTAPRPPRMHRRAHTMQDGKTFKQAPVVNFFKYSTLRFPCPERGELLRTGPNFHRINFDFDVILDADEHSNVPVSARGHTLFPTRPNVCLVSSVPPPTPPPSLPACYSRRPAHTRNIGMWCFAPQTTEEVFATCPLRFADVFQCPVGWRS